MKIKINGHSGSGKTLIMVQGVRKLHKSLTEEFPKEKHVVIYTSFGGLFQNGYPKYQAEDNFLGEIKSEFENIPQKEDSKVLVNVGSLLSEIMEQLGIYISSVMNVSPKELLANMMMGLA